MVSRCDIEAANLIKRIVQEYGWISVLKGIALVKPRSHDDHLYTPEYVIQCYESWMKSERHEQKPRRDGR